MPIPVLPERIHADSVHLLLTLMMVLTATPAPHRSGWEFPLPPTPAVVHTFDGPALPWLPGHRGVDLAAPAGTTVLAPHSGVVTFAGSVAGRAVISVRTESGLTTSLEPVLASVSAGTSVVAGSPIGSVQAILQYHCETACLHWGVRRGEDDYLDPLLLLAPRRYAVLLPTDPAMLSSAVSP